MTAAAEYSLPNEEEIDDALESALDSNYEEQYRFYLATIGEEAPSDSTVEVGTQFQIGDLASAEWALRKIRQAEQTMAEIDAAAQQQVDAVMAKAEALCAPIIANQQAENAKHEQTVRFFSQLLGSYHRKLLAEDPDRKTIKLAFGTLSARKAPDSWEFDSAKFLEWCQEPVLPTGEFDDEGLPKMGPDPARRALLRIKVEPDIPAAKKALTVKASKIVDPSTGEEVPGVTLVEGVAHFTVSPITEVSK